jgi:hypothetical protein
MCLPKSGMVEEALDRTFDSGFKTIFNLSLEFL